MGFSSGRLANPTVPGDIFLNHFPFNQHGTEVGKSGSRVRLMPDLKAQTRIRHFNTRQETGPNSWPLCITTPHIAETRAEVPADGLGDLLFHALRNRAHASEQVSYPSSSPKAGCRNVSQLIGTLAMQQCLKRQRAKTTPMGTSWVLGCPISSHSANSSVLPW